MALDPISLAITVALNAASMAITASRSIEGPRLTDLSVSVADYGTPLNNFLGTTRTECPCFFAEPITEVKKQSKGKGGKYKEYHYYGTWASFVADHEIDSFDAIFFDHHEVWNEITGIDYFSDEQLVSADALQFFKGTEDQEPPERMTAFYEAEEGADMTPHYKGVAYIWFQDIPLGQLGNRFPQVSCIASTNGQPQYPRDIIQSTRHINNNMWGATFSRDYKTYMWANGTAFESWNMDGLTQIASRTLSVSVNQQDKLGLYDDGTWLAMKSTNDDLLLFSADGSSYSTVQTFSGNGKTQQEVRVLRDGDGVEHWATIPVSVGTYYYVDGTEFNLSDPPPAFGINDKAPSDYFVDAYGDVWLVGRDTDNDTTTAIFKRIVTTSTRGGADLIYATGLAGLGGIGHSTPTCWAVHYKDNEEDHFVLAWEGIATYCVDINSGAVTHSADDFYSTFGGGKQFANLPRGATSIWVGQLGTFNEYSLKDLSLIRSLQYTLWGGTQPVELLYDKFNHAILGIENPEGPQIVRYLDRTISTNVKLYDVMNRLAEQCGMDSGDYDFYDLTQDVYGYKWTQGPARDAAAPLLDIHDSDVRLSGFTIEGKRRGRSASGSALSYDWFVRDGDAPLYSVRNIGDSDLPMRVSVTFSDQNAEYQPNTALATRNGDAVETVRELSIDLTNNSFIADNIQPLAERFLRRVWIGATTVDLKLTPKEMLLDCADVKDITLEDGVTIKGRLTRITRRANRVLECRFEQEDAVIKTDVARDVTAIITSFASAVGPANAVIASPGAEVEGRPPAPTYNGLAASEGFFLDAALASDADEQLVPFLYVASGPDDPSKIWPGSEAMRSDDNTVYETFAEFLISNNDIVWGTCLTILPDALSTVWDNGSLLYVNVYNGELTSATEAQLLNSETKNLIAVGSNANGWEWVQYRDATLQSADGAWKQYALEGLLRGRRGTEHLTDSHAASDRIMVWDVVAIQRKPIGANEIGDTDYYKMVSLGFSEDQVTAQTVAFNANAHRPLSPANVSITLDASGDYDFEWNARSRIGGAAVDGQDVPIGEASELYRVRILDGADAIRTIEATTQSATYTVAQQTADWGSAIVGLSIEVLQVSPYLNIEGRATPASLWGY